MSYSQVHIVAFCDSEGKFGEVERPGSRVDDERLGRGGPDGSDCV